MSRSITSITLVLLALSLLQCAPWREAAAVPASEQQFRTTEVLVNNSYPYSYVNEPVRAYLSFSQGEAFNNSIRIYDSSQREIPSQVWNVEYYPGGKYVHTCNITFLADLSAAKNAHYWVNYSSSDIGASNYTQWSDLRSSGDGFHRDIKVENSYYVAYIKANSTLGVFKFIPRPDNASLLWANASLTGYTLSLDGNFYSASDVQVDRVFVAYKGPVFTQVVISGSVGDISIAQSITFYAHSTFIDSSLEIGNSGRSVDWIRPMQIFLKHGAYENYTLSTGEGGTLAAHSLTYSYGNAYRPQAWWALTGRSGAMVFIQKPLGNLSFVILHDTPTFTTVANVGNETLISSKSLRLMYDLRICLLGKFDPASARALAAIFMGPPHAAVKLPVAFLSIELPRRIQIYSKFTIDVTITILQDINNCTLVLEVPPRALNVSTKLSAFLGNLKRGSIRAVSWSVFGTFAGTSNVRASFRSREGRANASSDVLVYIPVIAPPVRVKLRAVDYLGKLNMSLVNITFFDNQLFQRLWVQTDRKGYAAVFIEPGTYVVRVMDRGRLIGAKNVTIFGPMNVTINCWVYSVKFHILGPGGIAMPEGSRVLVILYDNATGTPVPIGSAVSNATGYAQVVNIRNGTYIVKGYVRSVESGGVNVGVNSEGPVYTLMLRFLTLKTRVMSDEEKPITNSTVSIYDFDGHLIDMRLTDEDGGAIFSNLAYQNYTYLVDWGGTRVASGFIYPNNLITDVVIRAKVYTMTVSVTDVWGNPLQRAQVAVRMSQSVKSRSLVTDDKGLCSLSLSIGNYTVDINSGGYVGSKEVNLKSSSLVEVQGGVNSIVYVTLAMSSSGWVALGFVWRWKTRGISYEELKVKEMVLKLDELYEAGEVEYPLYKKLKDEYSSQLRRVRTR
jgi:hypothetical protein